MEVIPVPVSDVKVRFRLRTPSDAKVNEIAESISQVSLINPITLDSNYNLLAGFHRLLAFKKLERDTIPSIIKDVDNRFSELVEVDENLKRNELNHIETADHIVKREDLLRKLGLTYERGDNRFTSDEEKLRIEDIADGIGLSRKSYTQRRQIANIHPEVKDMLVETKWADSLVDLVKLSSETDEIQKKVCNLLITGKSRTWKSAFFHAKLDDFKLKSSPRLDFCVKERWGFPQSIMQFKTYDDDLKKVCNLVNHDDDLRVKKGELRFGELAIKLHQMNPDQCRFAIDYYTQPNDVILEPFNGRSTTAITALSMGRRFIGFEINPKSYSMTKEVLEKHMEVPQDDWRLIEGCGCEMKELENDSESIDAVFSSPPYYNNAEPYSDNPRDLCNMEVEQFDERIDLMFSHLTRLIKKSNYSERIFHPIIFVVGTARQGEKGILDMSFTFQAIAKKYGLTLWDQQFVKLNCPYLQCSLQRNYELKFVQKNYESQLVWVKF